MHISVWTGTAERTLAWTATPVVREALAVPSPVVLPAGFNVRAVLSAVGAGTAGWLYGYGYYVQY